MRLTLCLSIAAAAAVPLYPGAARACGGFFCNQPGNPFDPPPVVQTAENVLFAVNPSETAGAAPLLEAHIQIFYSGPAAQFSWVLPVDAEPTLDVGSDALFTTLDTVTRPQFRVNYHDEGVCKPTPYIYDTTFGGPQAGGSPSAPVPPPSGSGGVDVSFRGAVGPYDAAVIHSTDPEALKEWLRSNMYFVSDQGSGLIDSYVAENKYFVALKLLNGKDVQSIRPIVLRFQGPAPCVPLRLTAIAAITDLRVNLWVLAAHRTVPLNFLEIALNQTKLDWLGGARNYDKMLSEAANEAGGNAFAAEYAGTARILERQLWYDGKFNLPKLRDATTPPAYLVELAAQQFPRDAKLLALLEKYIPEPASLVAAGVSERDFYNQIASYWASKGAEFAPFDAQAFTDELDTTIIAPLATGQALFDRFGYLTRLATFISPDEMNKDPIFGFNSEIGDVPVVRTADATYECGRMLYDHCTAPIRVRIPDGRTLRFLPTPPPTTGGSALACYGYAGGYDRHDIEALPSLERAWLRAEAGPGNPVADKGAVIDKMVEDHNNSLDRGCGCAEGTSAGRRQAALGGATVIAAGLFLALRRRRRSPQR